MQTPQWECKSGLIGRLFAEPWRFEFTPAVTLLMRWLGRHGVPHDEALTQVVRFENSLSLAFPAAEVETLRAEESSDGIRVALTPTCFGLLGVAGTLPLHDTDRCAHAVAGGNAALRAYLDIYSTRMVGQLWQAWAKPRLELAPVAEGRDASRIMLRSLGGKWDVKGEVTAWYAGLLRARPVSAATLEHIIACELGLPVLVESLAGFWDVIPPGQRFTLGSENCVLGQAALGTDMWRVDGRLRIVIGPLCRPDFYRMLPDGPGAKTLHDLLILATGQSLLDFEICLLPGPDCIEPWTLSDNPDEMRRLGEDTFLVGAPETAPEIRYLLELDSRGVISWQ
jgi:type VI secretion system protein ImpH